MNAPLLAIENLTLSFRTSEGMVKALDNVSFTVGESEVMGFVGESGSGKSVTALAILVLLPANTTVIESGGIKYRGEDLLHVGQRRLQRIRGKAISVVFQSPGGSLNPLIRVGAQLEEVIRIILKLDRTGAHREAAELFDRVGLPAWALRSYPHELSGGMQQRVCIAIAVSCHPDLLIADEPTSSLDVSVQAQILDLLRALRSAGLIRSIIFITHDFGVVDELCERVTVLYAGQVVETGRVSDVLYQPRHPYTNRLLSAIPRMDQSGDALGYIPGTVSNLLAPPSGCRFRTRCVEAMEVCAQARPQDTRLESGQVVHCYLFNGRSSGGRHA